MSSTLDRRFSNLKFPRAKLRPYLDCSKRLFHGERRVFFSCPTPLFITHDNVQAFILRIYLLYDLLEGIVMRC